MITPTYFTILPSTQFGFVRGTEFTVVANLPSNFTSLVWDFGDGDVSYNSLTANHIYNYAGSYNISVSAFYATGGVIADYATVDVNYKYRDSITILSQPTSYGTASLTPTQPFVLKIVSSVIDSEINLILQSINSQSLPHTALSDNKWNFLIPQWKFINSDTGEVIHDKLTITTTPISENGSVVAVSGLASFYYYDDSASTLNDCPLLLVATLCAQPFSHPIESKNYPYPGYANSEVTRASIGWQINETLPTDLKITENFINEIYPIKWSNIPIPVLVTCEYNSTTLNGLKVLSYPSTNASGSIHPIKIRMLSGVSLNQEIPDHLYTIQYQGSSFSPLSAPLYFRATDEIDTPSRGYLYATVTPLVSFEGPVCLSASTVAINGTGAFGFPKGFPIYPQAYISQPLGNTINRIGIVTYSNTACGSINYYQNLGTVASGNVDLLDTPPSSVFNVSNYTLQGTAAVYAMAFDPMKNRLYAADADQDKIYVYDNPGVSLTPTAQYNLSFYTSENYYVPSYISLDGLGNIWISMFGSLSCLKFDSNMSLLKVACPTVSFPLSTEEFGSLLVEPPIVETDSNNDIWACYAHPSNSMLVKFDSNGNELFKCSSLDLSSVPVSIAIDNFNNVWVACRESNTIECYDTNTGTKLSVLNNFYRPSYIMFDRSGDLWITHGINRISKWSFGTSSDITWKIDNGTNSLLPISNTYTPFELSQLYKNNEQWSGLSVDVFDNVWAINSFNNTAFVFKAIDPNTTQTTFTLTPTITSVQIINSAGIQQTKISSALVQSGQAAGDWTGNRWYQKYAGGKFQITTPTGKSSAFTVLDLDNGVPNIVKVNEEFNTAKYYKDLALPEILHDNTVFFDEFLKAVVGDGNPLNESLGRKIYERIANFTTTHGSLDTTEMRQLISLAKQTSVDVKEFAQEFPTEVERLLNLFSVNKYYLRGEKNYDTNLRNIIGKLLTITDVVTSGQTILMKDKVSSNYQPVYIAPLSGIPSLSAYPLFFIELDGAKTPVFDNYLFFEYNQIEMGYKNNIIQWESPYNTLTYNLSSKEEWYGEDQLVELCFNNLLTKKLFSE